ncbi:MAG: TetR/AcrR family transcriptional regulator [Oscillospiraceae bacterium]|nr:TetR/AcrR family transcriptional regulator [Oscillospiraceae bacterium]
MTEAFLALPEEKRRAIFHAAMAEFAEFGYEKASTNRIVQAAGIGKGMLFYYFGSKLELYQALLDQVSEKMEGVCARLLHHPERLGILETFQHTMRVKMELYLEDPVLMDFLGRLYLHPEEVRVTEGMEGRYARLLSVRERMVVQELFAKADPSPLREDIPRERLIAAIGFAIEGYTQHLIGIVRQRYDGRVSELDMDGYWRECDLFMEDLKKLFYKGEG